MKIRTSLIVLAACIVIGVLFSFAYAARTSSIREAAREGDNEKLKQMLQATPSLVNSSDRFGYTPLMIAALHRRVETVKILLDAGADPTILASKPPTTANAIVQRKLSYVPKDAEELTRQEENLRKNGVPEGRIRETIDRQEVAHTSEEKADWEAILKLLEQAEAKAAENDKK